MTNDFDDHVSTVVDLTERETFDRLPADWPYISAGPLDTPRESARVLAFPVSVAPEVIPPRHRVTWIGIAAAMLAIVALSPFAGTRSPESATVLIPSDVQMRGEFIGATAGVSYDPADKKLYISTPYTTDSSALDANGPMLTGGAAIMSVYSTGDLTAVKAGALSNETSGVTVAPWGPATASGALMSTATSGVIYMGTTDEKKKR